MEIIAILSLIPAFALAMNPSSLSLLLPTATPTGPSDTWDCALSTYSPFLEPPKPTAALLDAINSYGDKLLETCTGARCPYPDATKWCGFTTAAPSAVLPAYTSYASTASAWWASHSAQAMQLAEECPHYWYEASTDSLAGAVWLNQTIIWADCMANAGKAAAAAPSLAPSLAPSASPTLLSSPASKALPSPTSKGSSVPSSASSTMLSSLSWIWQILFAIWLLC